MTSKGPIFSFWWVLYFALQDGCTYRTSSSFVFILTKIVLFFLFFFSMWEYFEHKHFRSKCTRYLCLIAVRIYFKQKSKNRRSLGHSWGLLSPHLSKGSLTQILKEHILCHVLRENLEKWHFLLFYHPHVSARLIKINFKTCVSAWSW